MAMSSSVPIFVLIVVLGSRTLAKRQFNDEYPNVTVCESTLTTDMGIYDMPLSYRFLKAHFGGIHNCTHIEGNLIIRNIWPDGETTDLSFLENIEEVSGMVLMNNNSIDQIILPKLKVIRGSDFYEIPWNDSRRHKVSLFMKTSDIKMSAHLLLPNLKVISNHSVYFSSKTVHPYLPYSIQWSEFFEDETNQRLLTTQPPRSSFPCHSNCKLTRHNSNQGYCWSPLAEHCQEKTKCREPGERGTKWCYFKESRGQTVKRYCYDMCSGGCTGTKPDQCHVCKHYVNGEMCTNACPPEYEIIAGHRVKNPEYKLRVGMICARSCPINLLQQDDACIYRCTTPKYYRVNNQCVPCNRTEGCNLRECVIEESCNPKNSTSFFMNRPILENLTECEHVVGQLHFSKSSFDQSIGKITVPLLYQHLKNVRIITGNLAIDGSGLLLHNLTFLQNLEEIRHLKQKQCPRPGHTALNIFDTDLRFLGLRRLRHIFGDFFEQDNPNLCYLTTIPWSRHVLKSNMYKSDMRQCNKSCDPQCGIEGCWGPTSRMCYICTGFRAGYNCVIRCEDEPGFYTSKDHVPSDPFLISYDDGMCRQCNKLCLNNCTGPSAKDCFECRFFKVDNTCVEKCPRTFYPTERSCTPCNAQCFNDPNVSNICTGGGSHVGKGGCVSCEKYIFKDNDELCWPAECPDGYFPDISTSRPIKTVCKQCTVPCSKCSGRSLHRSDCQICNGFWSRDICVNKCKDDNSSLEQPTNSGGTCQLCHIQCEGCYSSENATQCKSCKHKRVYADYSSTIFTCVDACPSSHNYSFKVGDFIVCITQREGEINERNEQRNKVLNLVLWIVGPTVATLFLASIVLHEIFKRSRRMKSYNYLKAVYSNIHEPDSRVLLFNKESTLAQPNMNRLLLIPSTNIVFDIYGKPLGKGAFGSVYRGVWKLTNDNAVKRDRNELDVAVKVIQVVNQRAMEELLAEAKVMASVSHKHCLRLIGVCLLQSQPCLVTTFMELGSLDKYLKKHRESLSSYTLLSWAEQIANGMAYLEMRGIIHRDLATRNVLLNSSQLVQITDFGLSRILQGTEDNHEIVVTTGQVPIRWLAPETLEMGIYSHKTDVWAYGVTLWEIFTFGERPYDDIPIKDIPMFLSLNNRLCQPDICSIDTYTEMLNCWKDAQYRTTFEELMVKFAVFSQHPTYYLNIPNDPCRLVNNKYSGSDSDIHKLNDRTKAYMYKSLYRQLPSLDETIMTCLDDYTESEGNSKVRRQSSNLSYLSGKVIFTENRNSINSPLLFQSLVLREATEEEDGYLKPNKTKNLENDDDYLEPISRDL